MRRRIGISKRLRFEILRRDESTCRYCGRCPPMIALEIDHIIPVALGGSNDILNLVAACEECNAGKSARLLDDGSMQREQQATIERLRSSVDTQAAILADYEGIKQAFGNQIRQLLVLWWDVSGENLGEAWRCVLEKWISLFGFETVVKAMYAAAPRSITTVGAYAAVSAMDQKEPGTKRCYLIRGIIRKKFPEADHQSTIASLIAALRAGADFDYIEFAASQCSTVFDFRDAVNRAISDAMRDRAA